MIIPPKQYLKKRFNNDMQAFCLFESILTILVNQIPLHFVLKESLQANVNVMKLLKTLQVQKWLAVFQILFSPWAVFITMYAISCTSILESLVLHIQEFQKFVLKVYFFFPKLTLHSRAIMEPCFRIVGAETKQ